MLYTILFCMIIPSSFGSLPTVFEREDIFKYKTVFEREEIISRQNNPNINTIDDEFILHFDLQCLADKKSFGRNIISEFLTEFPCYTANNQKHDKFPEIMDKWIVVNKKSECNDHNKEIIWDDFCLKNVEQNEIWHDDSDNSYCDGCRCVSRIVDEDTYWNLNDACPDIEYGVNTIMYKAQTTDPNFDIIVMDRGISTTHDELIGLNITRIFDAEDGADISSDHGTFIAGIIGGSNVGVINTLSTSPFIKLIDVRIASTTTIDMLSGFDAIIDYLNRTNRKAIINLSFGSEGTGATSIVNRIETIYNLNGYMFVSAGNNNISAWDYYPASSRYTIAVGNHMDNLERHPSSNWGAPVDIYGPGTSIYSADYSADADTKYTTKTGTSFSAPFVAAVAANILASNPDYGFDDLLDTLLEFAAYDIDDGLGTTNLPRVQISCDEYSVNGTKTTTTTTTPSPTSCGSDISGTCYVINKKSFDGNYDGSYKQFCDGNGNRVLLLWAISNNCTNIDDIDIDGFNIPGSASVTYKYDASCC